MSKFRETRRLALASATALVAAGALASSASAASASVDLECKYPLISTQPVTATVSFDVPADAHPGQDVSLATTTELSLGGNVPFALDIIGAATFEADVKTSLSVGHRSTQVLANTGLIAYSAGSTDPVVASASGTADPVKVSAAATDVNLTGLTFSVTAYDANGNSVRVKPLPGVPDSDGDPQSFDVICTIPAGEDTLIGTIDLDPSV